MTLRLKDLNLGIGGGGVVMNVGILILMPGVFTWRLPGTGDISDTVICFDTDFCRLICRDNDIDLLFNIDLVVGIFSCVFIFLVWLLVLDTDT